MRRRARARKKTRPRMEPRLHAHHVVPCADARAWEGIRAAAKVRSLPSYQFIPPKVGHGNDRAVIRKMPYTVGDRWSMARSCDFVKLTIALIIKRHIGQRSGDNDDAFSHDGLQHRDDLPSFERKLRMAQHAVMLRKHLRVEARCKAPRDSGCDDVPSLASRRRKRGDEDVRIDHMVGPCAHALDRSRAPSRAGHMTRIARSYIIQDEMGRDKRYMA